MNKPSRYIVGLDLGTTNSALSYIDTSQTKDEVPAVSQVFSIPQLVKSGEVAEEPLLPSYLYVPGEGEIELSQLSLAWAKKRDFAVGRFARDHGATIPTRLISSSKSWLCHSGVDRRSALLPWGSEPEFARISPVEASRRILEHLRDAWNQTTSDKASRLENQEITLTVPASFDAVARELTVEAAYQAGLENVTLFEEPQAAFYAWLDHAGDGWRQLVKPGDVVLVVDVGGGTSDFTLIGVSDQGGDLALERLAVGDHLLLGGDNMDLALAHRAAQSLRQSGTKIDSGQMLSLWHAARIAKEKLLSSPKLESVPITVLGRGRKVIGGSIKTELSRVEIEETLVDGFFPRVPLSTTPTYSASAGLQELGLPYATDSAITKHLAEFISRHAESIARFRTGAACPSAVLFNGGVFQAGQIRERVIQVVSEWAGEPVRELDSAGLDRAVAQGAAYYGAVRRGRGVRIRGGVPRSYYIGVETAMPAIPGMARPIRAVCVLPKGTEEGSRFELPSREFGLVVGQEVEFRFLTSSTNGEDKLGDVRDDWEDDLQELAPLRTTIEARDGQKPGELIPVRLHGRATEIGTLELWCQARDEDHQWKLEFNVRHDPDDTRASFG